MNKNHRFPVIAVLSAGLFCFAASSGAEVFQSDDFDYPKGSIQGANGGIGWSGPWNAAGSGNAMVSGFDLRERLAPGYEIPVGPSVLQLLPGEKSRKVSRRFSPAIDLDPESPRVVYFSFIFCRLDGSDQQGYEVFAFGFSKGNNRVLGFDITSNENLQLSYFPQKKSVTGDLRVIEFTELPKTSPRYLFVGRIAANPAGQPDRFDFSVFGANRPVQPEPAAWDISLQADASEALDVLDIIAAPFLRNILVDNIRIGSDFSSVTRH